MYLSGPNPMAKNPLNLWLRYRTWFLRLSIPPSLRHHYDGKDKIVESLGTDSLSEAMAERDRRVAEYHARFKRLRTGAEPTEVEVEGAARRVYTAHKARPRGPVRVSQTITMPDDPEFARRLEDYAIETFAAQELADATARLGITLEPRSPM